MPDLTELLATVDLDDDRIEFLRDGSMALVGVLGNVMYGDLDEGIPKLH